MPDIAVDFNIEIKEERRKKSTSKSISMGTSTAVRSMSRISNKQKKVTTYTVTMDGDFNAGDSEINPPLVG